MEPIERIEVKEHGVIVGAWDITVCHDYRGIADYRQNAPYRAERSSVKQGPMARGVETILTAPHGQCPGFRSVDRPPGAR